MNRRLVSSLRSWISLNTAVLRPTPSHSLSRFVHTTAGSKCSNCGNEQRGDCGLSLIKCSSCSNLLSMPSSVPDYYSLFCLPNTFKLDTNGLRHQFLKLQRLLHPDKFSLATAETKESSEKWSSFLNKAYETLKDPQKRAVYLYQLGSGNNFDEEATLDSGTSTGQLCEMLQDILEIRMGLEECQDPGEVRGILDENAERINHILSGLGRAFERSNWEKAKVLLIELGYWKSIEASALEILTELEKS